MWTSILTSGSFNIGEAMICTVISLIIGLVIGITYMYTSNSSKNFIITLVLLPVMVQMVIMMVNGNLGTGVAILGAFSLVRFRSVPGSSKEMANVFFAMSIGLATSVGYVGFAVLMTVVICLIFIILTKTKFGEKELKDKMLKITIPENLDYTGVFEDLFEKYTKTCKLDKIKTTNLGSMFELSYFIELKDTSKEKEFIDAIRCRNGNLTIVLCRPQLVKDEL